MLFDGVSKERKNGKQIIDFSGDYRLFPIIGTDQLASIADSRHQVGISLNFA
jgi:hypothetical protein